MSELFQSRFPYKLTFDFRRRGPGPENESDWSTLGVASYSRMLTDYLTMRGNKWSKEREVVYLEDLGDAMMIRIMFAERLVSVETTTSTLSVEYEELDELDDEAA